MTRNNAKSATGEGGQEPTISTDGADWIIQQADLLPGDVLLYRSARTKKHQQKISEATGSPYTHASIYLGDGLVAESNFPGGVAKQRVEESIEGCQYVAVLRSQVPVGDDQPRKLNEFVNAVVENNRFYNLVAVVKFQKASSDYFDNQLEIIRENYGKVTSDEEFAQQSFFCSAFVVACYSVAGPIGSTAQIAYPPNAFSPGSLYSDPTFGWLLGYLVPQGGSVPEDDPIRVTATAWRDHQDCRWW